MKKKLFGLLTAVMIFTAGSNYAFNGLQQECPDKGTKECKLIKNCPDRGTPKCKLVEKQASKPSCCQKGQTTASVKKVTPKQ
ncbi:hypothetical protein [Daejeonella sp.]|uniref:hypothetical protein n=1 Tax=Daejeonella sp. TaxID=2805397 RepID=UPI003983D506